MIATLGAASASAVGLRRGSGSGTDASVSGSGNGSESIGGDPNSTLPRVLEGHGYGESRQLQPIAF